MIFYNSSLYALGIGAASFASGIRKRDSEAGEGFGRGNGAWERGTGTEPVEVTIVSTSSTTWSGVESERAKIERKARRLAGTPKGNS